MNASQTSVPGQVPHGSRFPHPSFTVPQVAPSDVQVAGLQAPHACVTGLHVSPVGHVPQSSSVPHWFSTYPHVAPSCAQVLDGTTHASVVGLHVSVALHAPQSSITPQPSG